MPKMGENELTSLVNSAKEDVVKNQGEFIRLNEKFLKYYNGEPQGDEEEGSSQVVSTDVADVVDSDMPSLVRTFLGSHEIMSFEAQTGSEAEIREAEEKTRYVNWLIRKQPNSFKLIHDWMKDAEIQKLGVVTYDYVEEEKVRELEYEGLSEEELVLLMQDLKSDKTLDKVDIIEQNSDDGEYYIKFRVTQEIKDFRVKGIPTENFLISRNATSKDEAEVVGHVDYPTKGDLIAAGYPKDLVKGLPSLEERDYRTNQRGIRFKDEGGENIESPIKHWASQQVEVYTLVMNVDYDGDGIAEKRRIVQAANKILDNEPFEVANYAILSAISMPHSAIGKSRAEITIQTQRIKTFVMREVMNNMAMVGGGRVVINESDTNIDDVLTQRSGGIVRTKSRDIRNSVAQLETPYIGDKALQVIQYVDSTQAQSTGNMLSNQGLDADKFYQETATRFEGVEDAGAAKIELVARVFAETGFKELYEGLAWMVSKYQNSKKEIRVLGKPLTVDPRNWRHDHYITSNVGLAAGDDEALTKNMGTLLTIQEQLKARGSILVDEDKIYSTLQKVTQSMGIARVDEFFNDPEVPEETLMAANEQLMSQVEQLMTMNEQLQQQAQFTEGERLKAQASLITAQGKQQTDILKIKEDARQHAEDLTFNYDKLELENQVDIPGEGSNG